MKRKRKIPRQLTKQQIEKIKDKIEKCMEYLELHDIFIRETPRYQSEMQSSLQLRGYSLVKTTNLADCYKVSEFCEANNLEFESNAW